MFFRAFRRFRNTLGVRLTLWYSAIFTFSSLLLFGLAYFLGTSQLRERDRQIIQEQFSEYATAEKTGGFEEIAREFRVDEASGALAGFLVRVAGPQNQTLLLNIPRGWQKELFLKAIENEASSYEKSQWTTLRRKGHKLLDLVTYRLPSGLVLQVGRDSRDRQELLERFGKIFIIIVAPLLVLSFVGGLFLASRALRPIRDLIQTVRNVERGEMEARVPSPRTGDELDELTQLFNGMLARIEMLVTGMRDALDNVAHDLRTPVTRLRGSVEAVLRPKGDSGALREALLDCAEESERIVTMLNMLLDISEAETGTMNLDLAQVNLVSLIRETVELYQYVAEEKGVMLETALPDELYARVDSGRMKQIIANLLDNAIKYSSSGGMVHIEACQQGDDGLSMSIKDTGSGISSDDLPKIFDRLYRGDKSRSERGLGLGLSLVQAVVRAHKGHIEVESSPGEGSLFRVFLPANPDLRIARVPAML
jgi:signal transduction histidine kinase